MNDPRLKSESEATAPVPFINIHLTCHLMALALLFPFGTQVSCCAILMDRWWHNDGYEWSEVVLEGNGFKARQHSFTADRYVNRTTNVSFHFANSFWFFWSPRAERTLIGIIPSNQRWNLSCVAQNNKTGHCCDATTARWNQPSTVLC